ncbi:unnamed protein product [Cylindrotheca closterium]|uniref:Uncharacterized protein n=1 Tax=Cylindrotheca closterium TaxID=2856 RepID=A0AAD2CHG6_9STRA|nr:unnamed protein product [Cylindrotheca closterium]
MKDSITKPPEKEPKSITPVADQGQGGLEAKTGSNLTTQLSIALTKDNPALTRTPKSQSKQTPPSKIAEDGTTKGRLLLPPEIALTKDNPDPKAPKSQRKQPAPSFQNCREWCSARTTAHCLQQETQGVKVSQALQEGRLGKKEVFGNQAFAAWFSRTAKHTGLAFAKCVGLWADVNMKKPPSLNPTTKLLCSS